MSKIITRTITTNSAKALVMDDKRNVIEKSYTVPANINSTDKAENYIRKHSDDKLIMVESLSTAGKLYGMEEEKFISWANIYEERSKENRGMISKVVKTKYANCLVMEKETRKVLQTLYIADNESKARKVAKTHDVAFIEVLGYEESENLYCMSIEDFIKNARPMVDHFTFE